MSEMGTRIAAALRGTVARKDVRQVDLAQRVGISQSQLSKVLRGVRPITVDQLDALCAALGVSIVSIVAQAVVGDLTP